ncbi:hypothetical protein BOTBODRAFT_223454 [Botryobasidium botryosum FD-172 SS1]|uniref:Uncharacterized protein n=1 Tax=Botryobasidium botryosum (strain FD-172 SS1) TaxID=930990 RepID=A0A067MQP3_BOTB1|nr:hypothetical protein BOTBODRAFT_223454 [Botryobasidium botryosum FD-172 SS1]
MHRDRDPGTPILSIISNYTDASPLYPHVVSLSPSRLSSLEYLYALVRRWVAPCSPPSRSSAPGSSFSSSPASLCGVSHLNTPAKPNPDMCPIGSSKQIRESDESTPSRPISSILSFRESDFGDATADLSSISSSFDSLTMCEDAGSSSNNISQYSPPSPSPPAPTYSFTPDQIAALVDDVLVRQLAIAPRAAPIVAYAPPITNPMPQVPTYVPSVTAPHANGRPLSKTFPTIDVSVLAEIMRHEFKPRHLYKLDSYPWDKSDRTVFHLKGGHFAVKDSPCIKDYPSYSSLIDPLEIYFNVLVQALVGSGRASVVAEASLAFSKYLTQLRKFSDDNEWAAVLQYHMECYHKRIREMEQGDYSGWAYIDSEARDKFLRQRPRTHAPISRKSSSPPKPRAKAAMEICNKFNVGACPSPCENGRLHKCKTCSGTDHGQSACSKSST